MSEKVYLASDHGGFDLKESVKTHLQKKGREVIDVGNKIKDENDDYPDFVIPLAKQVSQEPESVGVVFGRSGNGEAIAANKVAGIRAAVCMNEEMARKARMDNHANVISLGADFISDEKAKKTVDSFLNTAYSQDERHERRVQKIIDYESAHTGQH